MEVTLEWSKWPVEKELVTTLLKFCCPPLPKLMGEPACSLAVKDDLK